MKLVFDGGIYSNYYGVFLFVGRCGVSGGFVALVVAVRIGSDDGNDGEENNGDLLIDLILSKNEMKT